MILPHLRQGSHSSGKVEGRTVLKLNSYLHPVENFSICLLMTTPQPCHFDCTSECTLFYNPHFFCGVTLKGLKVSYRTVDSQWQREVTYAHVAYILITSWGEFLTDKQFCSNCIDVTQITSACFVQTCKHCIAACENCLITYWFFSFSHIFTTSNNFYLTQESIF